VKTQIIQLNRNDDYLSVRDKMDWSQTGRILLVWPDQGHVLNRHLDLKLVNRHAAMMGAQLAVVTHNSEVRFLARQIGIPVFDSSRRAQDIPWRVSQHRKIDLQRNSQYPNLNDLRKIIHPQTPAGLEHPITRFLCFGCSVFALFAIGMFILPSAQIILSPQVETQSMRFDLSADPSLTAINLSTGSLTTYRQDVIVEGNDSITATGSAIIANEIAIGGLQFTNISNQKIFIPAGTIVATVGRNPVRFITSNINSVTVNPNQSINLTAHAIKPGSSGNLPPDNLVAIEGGLGLSLSATNPSATHGGTDASIPSPSSQDLRLLRDRLRSKLELAAMTEMQSILPDEDTLISPTLTIGETLVETYNPSIGAPGNRLELSLRLRIQSQVVSGEALRSLVTLILDSNTPNGYIPLLNTLEITRLSNPTFGEEGLPHWTILANRKLQVDIQENQVIENIKGVTVAQAVDRLSTSLPLAEHVQILLSPEWWPRLPFIPMRMEVVKLVSR
jgi:hypothetical protein